MTRDGSGALRVVIPGRRFAEHLALGVGLIRRYGAREPTVAYALLRPLTSCAVLSIDDPERWSTIERQAELVIAAAERETPFATDLATAYDQMETLRGTLGMRRTTADRP